MPGGQVVKAIKVAKTIVVKAVGTTKGVIIKPEAQKKIWQNKKKKDKKKKDEKFKCRSDYGSNKLKTKLEKKIDTSRKELKKVYNAVIRRNSRDQREIIEELVDEVENENSDTLNLWTSDIAGSHVQRCYNYKTLESWTATKDLVNLQNLLVNTMEKHCTDYDQDDKKIPPKIWKNFEYMWDECSREFVKTSMENQKNRDKRTDITYKRDYLPNILTYNMMFTYPAEKDLNVLLSYEKTFWRSELPEIIEHLSNSEEDTYLRDYVKNLNVFASCNQVQNTDFRMGGKYNKVGYHEHFLVETIILGGNR